MTVWRVAAVCLSPCSAQQHSALGLQACTAPFLRCCPQALGDIALRKGVKNLDSFLESDAAPSDPTLDPELLGAPLLDVLLCTLQRWEEGLETLAKPAKRKAKSAATSEQGYSEGTTLSSVGHSCSCDELSQHAALELKL